MNKVKCKTALKVGEETGLTTIAILLISSGWVMVQAGSLTEGLSMIGIGIALLCVGYLIQERKKDA